VAAGVGKASKSWADIFKLGIVSGCHIGFGAYLAITVGGACPGIAAENPGLQKVCEFYEKQKQMYSDIQFTCSGDTMCVR
jgi:hypothetical protein